MRFSRATVLIALVISAPLAACAATADQQAALQQQLNQINQQIADNQTKLAAEAKQRTTLESQVEILDSQIQEAQLEIKQRDLTIQQLKDGIAQKESGISTLDSKVSSGEQSLAQIVRYASHLDDTPLAVQLLNGSLRDTFQEMSDYEALQKSLNDAFTTMGTERADLAAREQALQTQQQEQSDLLQLQVAQQNSLKSKEQEKQNLVTAAKGQEALYQQVIASQQQTAAQIKAQLFALNNANHSTSFGDMYSYAQEASAKTGVSPAFIMGILSEESNLGQNVGTCSYQDAMNPKNDIPDFMQITSQLGLDPNSVKVSCKPWYGWGGAMGPAQFIPSTWLLYQDRIATASGQNPPNPWDPRTATFASAILLSDNGAGSDAASQRLAALRYFAGWKNASNPAYAFYGDDVMCLTQKMQQQIDVLIGAANTNEAPISC